MLLLLSALTAAAGDSCTYEDTVRIFAGRPSSEGVGFFGQSAFTASNTDKGLELSHSGEALGVITKDGFDGRTDVLWPQEAILTVLSERGLPNGTVDPARCDERTLTRALVLAFPDQAKPEVHVLFLRPEGAGFQVLSSKGKALGDTHASPAGSWKLSGEQRAAWIVLRGLWSPPKHYELH